MERFVILDTETSGLSKHGSVCKGHRILSIAMVEVINDRVTNNDFYYMLNPDCSISPKASEINGIKQKDLVGKPKFKSIAKRLLTFIGDSPVVIHNAQFDIQFLDQEFLKLPLAYRPKKDFKYIDTLELARFLYPGLDNSLDALASSFGIKGRSGKHNALEDVKILAQVFLHLKDEIDQERQTEDQA